MCTVVSFFFCCVYALIPDPLRADTLMEGLISAPIKSNPVQTFCSRQCKSLHALSLAPRFTRRVLIRPAGVMKCQKSLNSVAASVQPLEASGAGSFNNTLPSKGTA